MDRPTTTCKRPLGSMERQREDVMEYEIPGISFSIVGLQEKKQQELQERLATFPASLPVDFACVELVGKVTNCDRV